MKQFLNTIWGMLIISLFFVQCSTNQPEVSVLGEINYPEDNLFDQRKVDLGKKLFFDTRLSVDNSISCATCHVPSKAFTDQLPMSRGVNNHFSTRNAPSLLNVGYLPHLMFDAEISSLELQAIVPIQDTNEMNFLMGDLAQRLSKDDEYVKLANDIFDREVDAFVITRSLAAFQRTLISDNSKYDQWKRGEVEFTTSEKLGHKLFTEDLHCTKCHPAPLFTTGEAENNGLYADYKDDKGRFRINVDTNDIGKFKVPSLRNIELTFPYMHDGSFSNLEEVIEHYKKGGEKHFNQSEIIQPFELNSTEKKGLIDFLKTLTDTSYLAGFQD